MVFVSVDTVFLLVIVGSILFIAAAGYVPYPKWFKSHTPICLKNFLKALPLILWLFHLLLMLSGDIEVNPGPKSKTNQHTAKSGFISDLNADASLAHSDPKELATKYHVNVQTVQRGIVYHYNLRVSILFLRNLYCYSSMTSCYAKNIMYISDLLEGGSTTTNLTGLHVALIWIMLTTIN